MSGNGSEIASAAAGQTFYKRIDSFSASAPTDESFAFIVRQNFDEEKQYDNTDLVIKSRYLEEIINIVLLGAGLNPNTLGILSHTLYHLLSDFRRFDPSILMSVANPQQAEACRSHLDALTHFLESEYSSELTLADKLLSYDPPQMTFDLLWLIFKPNTLIFVKDQKDNLGGHVFQIDQSITFHDAIGFICRSVRFDGMSLGLGNRYHGIQGFEGTKPVAEISIFPLKYHISRAWLEPKLVERGRKFVNLCKSGKAYVCCERMVEIDRDEDPYGNPDIKGNRVQTKIDLKGRVMLDPETFWNLENPKRRPSVTAIDGNLDDTHFQICGTCLPGFIMEHKQWAFIPIAYITDIQWADDMLTNIVLDQVTKDLIQDFITIHRSNPTAAKLSEDIIPGRGAGLVMLFTGPPGVGKTATVEAVAETTHRPLYSISANELGSEPIELDKNLMEIFRKGTLWDAILLLDDAEVFLEQRASFDIKRNSLVSTFIQRLEHYAGIIILTSNRVETFDKALESRVRFNLRFQEPDRVSRKQLWNYFLRNDEAFSVFDRGTLADLKFNGRMIQHAVSLGRSLAIARRESFSFFHIRRVLNYIDLSRHIPKQPHPDEPHYASPLDPAMSVAATPSSAIDSPDTHRSLVREVINRESRAQRSPGSGTGMDDSTVERGTKRPRFSLE